MTDEYILLAKDGGIVTVAHTHCGAQEPVTTLAEATAWAQGHDGCS